MSERTVVVFGRTGLLGRAVCELTPDDWHVLAPAREDCDLADRPSVRDAVVGGAATLVINAAGYTRVDDAESKPDAAARANALGARNVAMACAEAGARLVHISSDYVFDGTAAAPYDEDAPVNPRSVYGRTKAEGEDAVRGALPGALIVRSQWLFGDGSSFVSLMRDRARRGQASRVVRDQHGRPTYARDLAAAVVELAGHDELTGTIHAANDGEATWHELAAAIYRHLGAPDELVHPVSAAELGAAAARPSYSVLSLDRLHALGIRPRHWQLALTEFLET